MPARRPRLATRRPRPATAITARCQRTATVLAAAGQRVRSTGPGAPRPGAPRHGRRRLPLPGQRDQPPPEPAPPQPLPPPPPERGEHARGQQASRGKLVGPGSRHRLPLARCGFSCAGGPIPGPRTACPSCSGPAVPALADDREHVLVSLRRGLPRRRLVVLLPDRLDARPVRVARHPQHPAGPVRLAIVSFDPSGWSRSSSSSKISLHLRPSPRCCWAISHSDSGYLPCGGATV